MYDETCFIDINAWGRLGEQVRNYLRKGSQAFIEGHLVFSEWQTQEGQKRNKLRVTADTVQFLDPASRNQGGQRGGAEDYDAPPPFRDSTPPSYPEREPEEAPPDSQAEEGGQVPF